jgi:hypothetical protein
MNLLKSILKMHPAAQVGVDFEIRDDSDGNGPKLVMWDTEALGNEPSKEDIAAASKLVDDDEWDRERGEILDNVRNSREVALNRLIGIALSATISNDADTVAACMAARSSLLGITSHPDVLGAKDRPSITSALTSAYSGIVAAAPDNLRSAFRDFRL